jgi:hypothetical protein
LGPVLGRALGLMGVPIEGLGRAAVLGGGREVGEIRAVF